MDMGLVGINPTDGTAETIGITTGTTLGATAVTVDIMATTGTTLGAGTVHGAAVDIMATAVTVDIMATGAMADIMATAATAVSAVLIYGTTKDGAETSLAAVQGAVPNLRPTTDYGGSKFNRD